MKGYKVKGVTESKARSRGSREKLRTSAKNRVNVTQRIRV